MEYTVSRENFLKSLGKIQGVVERKNTMPILANTLIRSIKEDEVELVATDLDITIIDKCPAEIKKKGSLTLNARKLFEIFRELEEGEVSVKKKGEEKTEISAGKTVYTLQTVPSDEYPAIPELKDYQFTTLSSLMLSEMIEKTIYACAGEEGRFTLNGIFMEKKEKENFLRMVATDGHRMAIIDREVEDIKKFQLEKGVILPKKGMVELKRILEPEENKLEMSAKDNHIVFKFKNTTLFMRLVDGEFPEYQRVIPEKNPLQLVVKREEFLKSLRQTAVMVDEKARAIKLVIKKGKLELKSKHPSLGESSGECSADYNGEPIEIGFNDKYIFDILSAVSGEKIKMEIKDELSPVVFTTDNDTKYLCIVMPMRI